MGEAAEEASQAHEVAAVGEADAEALVAGVDAEEPEPATEESVIEDGDGIAVEGASVAEALKAEPDSDEDESEESLDEVDDSGEAAAEDVGHTPDSPDPDEVAAEGASVAEALAAEVEPEPDDENSDTASRSDSLTGSNESFAGGTSFPSGGRVRQWLRRRRNR
ncbi:Uncharacterised protein [Mycolicibacterium vanbaalenii]|uniref:Uncharacterized protein n=1 Tax=Mycolicibacterium vanbaalenii TaxID=110539 RepID=A0A5S9NPP6_MYCVN|nr:Uncharacterised protein [Mycolicibacterium vanbaalenii]